MTGKCASDMSSREPTATEKLLSEALGYPVDLTPKKSTKREILEDRIKNLQERQLQRINKGRTRGAGAGAGAGGFNRDIENIVHQIRLAKIELDELDELDDTA